MCYITGIRLGNIEYNLVICKCFLNHIHFLGIISIHFICIHICSQTTIYLFFCQNMASIQIPEDMRFKPVCIVI